MNRPLFGTHPMELGLEDHEEEIFRRFSKNKNYKKLIDQCCTLCNGKLDVEIVKKAIAKYIHGLDSRQSVFDKFKHSGDSSILPSLAREGLKLFYSDSIDCAACHGGNDFLNQTVAASLQISDSIIAMDSTLPVIPDYNQKTETRIITVSSVFLRCAMLPSLRHIIMTVVKAV